VLGAIEKVLRRCKLHQLAVPKHGHPVAHLTHHRKVVADEEHGKAQLLLQVFQQIQDLSLNRHIEGRGRLVANEEPRARRQCACDADTLALAAGELVRIAAGVRGRETDLHQEIGGDFPRLVVAGDEPVEAQRLGDNVPDPHARIQ
jgi:hypothetical protein